MNNFNLNTANYNILIVDDVRTNLHLLSRTLTQKGYQVSTVMSGDMALKEVTKNKPDLILLDVMMPEMDGYEVCKKLKSSPETEEIPVIFLSTLDETLDKVQAFEVGGVDYITKPFQFLEVVIRIENQLKLQRAKAEIQQLNLELEDKIKQRTIELEKEIIEHKETQEELRHRTFYDPLTGLANRSLFLELLRQEINLVKRTNSYLFAVLFLDCDRFKNINDSLGHLIGDQILVEVSRRLQSCLRPSDRIARLGGDEFTILLENIEHIDYAVSIAKKINKKLSKPFYIKDKEIFLTGSIGIVKGNKHYETPEMILRDADTAMYKAKNSGRSCYQMFTTSMHTEIKNALTLESKLRRAIENNELNLVYQPIKSLLEDKVVGFEALLRWNAQETGFVSPTTFIPIAEETGLIIPIGMWTLRKACRQLKIWEEKKQKSLPLTMSVNFSVKQFAQSDVVEKIQETIDEIGINPRQLKLEITETAIMENPELASSILEKLRALDIQFSIDDFGTGYSSLSYLYRFPANTLKIDRSFIKRITKNRESFNIIESIITIAHHLKMEVIAEGIETLEQLEKLKALKCEYGQGYLFAKPLEENLAYENI